MLSSTTSSESARAQTRVLLVDDNQAILSRARAVLAPACLVVGQAHETHDVRRLYVVDGASVPTSLGVNPQVTIMARATRAAERIAAAM